MRRRNTPRISFIGFGEAGQAIAAGLTVEATVRRRREMGAIGKDEKVRVSLTQGRAAMLDAIGKAKNARD